jgi:hypothetical protein
MQVADLVYMCLFKEVVYFTTKQEMLLINPLESKPSLYAFVPADPAGHRTAKD